MDRAGEQLQASGAKLVLIGQATPRHAAHFRRRQGIEVAVLADEKRESYRAAGAKIATTSELVGPKVMAKGAVNTVRRRAFQSRPIGHPAQLGGTLIIRPGGEVAWSHMSEDASDNAEPQEVLAALRALNKR